MTAIREEYDDVLEDVHPKWKEAVKLYDKLNKLRDHTPETGKVRAFIITHIAVALEKASGYRK